MLIRAYIYSRNSWGYWCTHQEILGLLVYSSRIPWNIDYSITPGIPGGIGVLLKKSWGYWLTPQGFQFKQNGCGYHFVFFVFFFSDMQNDIPSIHLSDTNIHQNLFILSTLFHFHYFNPNFIKTIMLVLESQEYTFGRRKTVFAEQ